MTPIGNFIHKISTGDHQAAQQALSEIVKQKLQARYTKVMQTVKKGTK